MQASFSRYEDTKKFIDSGDLLNQLLSDSDKLKDPSTEALAERFINEYLFFESLGEIYPLNRSNISEEEFLKRLQSLHKDVLKSEIKIERNEKTERVQKQEKLERQMSKKEDIAEEEMLLASLNPSKGEKGNVPKIRTELKYISDINDFEHSPIKPIALTKDEINHKGDSPNFSKIEPIPLNIIDDIKDDTKQQSNSKAVKGITNSQENKNSIYNTNNRERQSINKIIEIDEKEPMQKDFQTIRKSQIYNKKSARLMTDQTYEMSHLLNNINQKNDEIRDVKARNKLLEENTNPLIKSKVLSYKFALQSKANESEKYNAKYLPSESRTTKWKSDNGKYSNGINFINRMNNQIDKTLNRPFNRYNYEIEDKYY